MSIIDQITYLSFSPEIETEKWMRNLDDDDEDEDDGDSSGGERERQLCFLSDMPKQEVCIAPLVRRTGINKFFFLLFP